MAICTARALRIFLLVSVISNAVLLMRTFSTGCLWENSNTAGVVLNTAGVVGERQRVSAPVLQKPHNNDIAPVEVPMVARQVTFVGGVPRSGTTLLRAMLDAHPEVHCGEETRVIPRILGMRSRWDHSDKEHQRLVEAGLDRDVLDRATRAFVSEIILGHGPPAKYLCSKDPLALNYMQDVVRLYPKAKFVLMLRDGRAVAYSIVSRNVTITGVNSKSYMAAALFWNKVTTRMVRDCSMLGKHRCLEVQYENLVRSPKEWMQVILEFLGVPWSDNVLQHHKFIDSEVLLSKLELSSSQVKEAVNTAALHKWRTKMPLSIQKNIYKECDMLKELGYQSVQ